MQVIFSSAHAFRLKVFSVLLIIQFQSSCFGWPLDFGHPIGFAPLILYQTGTVKIIIKYYSRTVINHVNLSAAMCHDSKKILERIQIDQKVL